MRHHSLSCDTRSSLDRRRSTERPRVSDFRFAFRLHKIQTKQQENLVALVNAVACAFSSAPDSPLVLTNIGEQREKTLHRLIPTKLASVRSNFVSSWRTAKDITYSGRNSWHGPLTHDASSVGMVNKIRHRSNSR